MIRRDAADPAAGIGHNDTANPALRVKDQFARRRVVHDRCAGVTGGIYFDDVELVEVRK